MSERIHFTHERLDALDPAPAGKRVWYRDDRVLGLALMVTDKGAKTFYSVRWHPTKGKTEHFRLGRYPDLTVARARELAGKDRAAVADGKDPVRDRREARREYQDGITVRELADAFLELHAKVKKRSWRQDYRRIKGQIIPAWGFRKADEIRRRDVIALLDAIVARGAEVEANRTLALVRKLFNWANERDLLEGNPCLGVRAPGEETARERVLSDDEIRAVWNGCARLSPAMCAIFRLRLVTAQRGAEIAAMAWEHVDLKEATWWIPPEAHKGKRGHLVPLSPMATEILQGIKQSGPWVFAGRGNGSHVVALGKAGDDLVAASGVEFHPHDLRRTASTGMAAAGVEEWKISKVLGHAAGPDVRTATVTGRYNRYDYLTEKREALDRWALHLAAILGDWSGKVVALRTAVSQEVRHK